MLTKAIRVSVLAVFVSLAVWGTPLAAQGDPDAWTLYALNMRAGPGAAFAVVTTLAAQTSLYLEARNADTSWVLAHTGDGALRGWLSVLYLGYREGFAAWRLPISDETLNVAAAPADAAAGAEPTTGNPALTAYLAARPVVPGISARARAIYAGSGNNPHMIAKIGDCNTEEWIFLSPFDTGQYDLGSYAHLQPTVDFFQGAWSRDSLAAYVGYNALTLLNPAWADPAVCHAGESPVSCELRLSRAAVAVIMLGPNDVYNLSLDQYDQSLRQMVDGAIQHGTIPVLTTFAWCGGGELGDKALQLNSITANIAQEYDIPLINFWAAAQALPNCGLPDGIHLSAGGPPYGAYFTGDETQAGFTLRNLVTLQTLDALRQAALY